MTIRIFFATIVFFLVFSCTEKTSTENDYVAAIDDEQSFLDEDLTENDEIVPDTSSTDESQDVKDDEIQDDGILDDHITDADTDDHISDVDADAGDMDADVDVDGESADDDVSTLFTGIRIIKKGGFFRPRFLFTDGSSRLAVIEDNNNIRVRIFDLTGTEQCNIGEGAIGVAFDDEGNIYTTAFGNEIRKYDSSCVFLKKASGSGSGDGQFAGIGDIHFYNNKLYILDKNNERIQLFTKDLVFDSVLNIGELDRPEYIDLNSSGHIAIYEAGFSEKKVRVFKSDLTEDWSINVSTLSGIALRNNGTLVSTYAGKNCARLYKQGTLVYTIGSYGDPDGILDNEFDVTRGVVSLDDGSVLIADEGNSRIKKFAETSPDTLELSNILYGSDYRFSRIGPLSIDSNDHLYFTDSGMVRVIDEFGDSIRTISSPGEGENELYGPWMMTVDSDSVFVMDTHNNYLYSFSKDGLFQKKTVFNDNIVLGMADDSNYVYVAERDDLFRYSKTDISTSETVTLQGLSDSVEEITNGADGVLFVYAGTNLCRFVNADSDPVCIVADELNVMAEDNDGNLLVVDDLRLRKYDKDLNELGTLDRDDMGDYNFLEYVKGLAVDSNGYVYIAESTSARSQIVVIDLHF